MSRSVLKLSARRAQQALERAQAWLASVALGAFAGRYPHMLSGGQRKRVGLAQVLIRDPKILLMDEPFGPLDAQTRQIMGNLLLDLWNADRKAVLFVTHDLEEAIALADRVVIMSAGPSARIIGDWRVPLPRPRDISEVRMEKEFHSLHREIWSVLKDEVLKGYAQSAPGQSRRRAAKANNKKVSVMLIRKSMPSAIVALIALGGAPAAYAQGVFYAVLARLRTANGCRKVPETTISPNCVGDFAGISWANPPEGTKSYAFLIFDLDCRPPGGVSHWVAYGIPPSVTGFAEGEVSKPSTKYVGGQSTMKLSTYFGPCTPPGPPHHYIFTLMASDLEPNAFKEGLTREQLFKELDGHAKAATSLVVTFSKQ